MLLDGKSLNSFSGRIACNTLVHGQLAMSCTASLGSVFVRRNPWTAAGRELLVRKLELVARAARSHLHLSRACGFGIFLGFAE